MSANPCFCVNKDNASGNPAGVVYNTLLNTSEKELLTRKLNLPVLVFVSDLKISQPQLEFFYPIGEMPLCLHGTLAAGYFLCDMHSVSQVSVMTKGGGEISIRRQNHLIQACVSKKEITSIIPKKAVIEDMLQLPNDLIDETLPLRIASVGSPKLFIPVCSPKILSKLSPQFDFIKQWSIKNHVNGIYVYAKDSNKTEQNFYARGFNPKTGHNEDAATGVAAAALSAFLKKSITVLQGESVSRPSEIVVDYESDMKIWVGGDVYPYAET